MSPSPSQAGHSLIEVLLALLLVAIGVLSVAPMFVSSARVNATGGDVSRLSAVAAARMEDLRAARYHELVAGGSLVSNDAGYSDTSVPDLDVRWQIVDGGGPAGCKTITVVVESQIPGRQRSVEMTTLRAR